MERSNSMEKNFTQLRFQLRKNRLTQTSKTATRHLSVVRKIRKASGDKPRLVVFSIPFPHCDMYEIKQKLNSFFLFSTQMG